MNTRRLIVLLLAAVAAGGAALIMRGLLGGGTPKADARPVPPPIALSQVLVASADLHPGDPLSGAQVQWQKWPTANVNSGFITDANGNSPDVIVAGTVVRAPIATGEPITFSKIVKSDAAGFMAATLQPGMRAVSINVSVASVAGGFIQPNDRVDIILTEVANELPKRTTARVVLADVRVLAIDQAFDGKNQKAVSDAKTATLELSPAQAQAVIRAQATGPLSLALRALGDHNTALNTPAARLAKSEEQSDADDDVGDVTIIRYGSTHTQSAGGRH